MLIDLVAKNIIDLTHFRVYDAGNTTNHPIGD